MRGQLGVVVLEQTPSTLHAHGVRCVLMGGFAAVLYGSPFVTTDIDVVPASDDETSVGSRMRCRISTRESGP